MFQVGDYVVHGNNGVCEVMNIGTLNLTGIPKDKIYYTLCPYHSKGSKIFAPADNQKIIMRPVITKDEAMSLIGNIKNIEFLWIQDDKRRELEYKEAFRKCDCNELVKIIKTIYLRKQSRLAEGKKVTSGDEKYFHLAEDSLYGELAIPLGMEKEKVRDYIITLVDQVGATQD